MTITKTIGSGGGRDYSTLTAFEAALPATLADNYVGSMYNDSEFIEHVTFQGFTAGSFTVTVQPASGQGFGDNANKLTNALRYNVSNGVGIRNTTSYEITISFESVTNVFLVGLQIANDVASRQAYYNAHGSSPLNTTNCLFQCNSSSASYVVAFNCGVHINPLVITKSTSADGVTFGYVAGGTKVINATIVRPSNITAAGNGFNNNNGGTSSPLIKNCAVFGFTNFASQNNSSHVATGSDYNASDKTIGFGSHNQASLTYANQFQDTSSSTMDFREKSGANLITAGVVDTTDNPAANDIVGTARGASWDIGCWQYSSPGTNITPGTGALTLTGVAPALGFNTAVGTGALSLTGYGPSLKLGIGVGTGALSLTGYAPTLIRGTVIQPDTGALSLAGAAPGLGLNVAVSTGALTLTGYPPSLGGVTNITVGTGALLLTGAAPSLGLNLAVGTGALTLTGYGPVVGRGISPGTGALTLTGVAPRLGLNVSVTTGSLTLAGYSPSVNAGGNINVTVATGALLLTGFAPALNATLRPGTGALTLTGIIPTIGRGIAVGTGALTLTGISPALGTALQPGTGSLVLTGGSLTLGLDIAVASGVLALTGYAPNVNAGGNISITVGTGTLLLTGLIPVLDRNFLIGTGVLSLTGYSPAVGRTHDISNVAVGVISDDIIVSAASLDVIVQASIEIT